MHAVIDTPDFLSLSASIHYQLSGIPPDWAAIQTIVFEGQLKAPYKDRVTETMEYLCQAYGETRRRLGPNAILHPIRVLALLRRVGPRPNLLTMMTTLLHDLREDISPERFDQEEWSSLEARYTHLVGHLDKQEAAALDQLIDDLTRRTGEKYYQYLGRLLGRARKAPELLSIKLADRLDNTLDLRLDLQGPVAGVDAPRALFELLFTENPWPAPDDHEHPAAGKLNGALRLYQLFKNVVFLSLLRQEEQEHVSQATTRLSRALATAGLDETERILLHLFTYHLTERSLQRKLVMDMMSYCQSSAIERVTPEEAPHALDGLFGSRFDHPNRKLLHEELDRVYRDKELMAQIAVAFAAVFSSFLRNPSYQIKGIDADGFHPRGV